LKYILNFGLGRGLKSLAPLFIKNTGFPKNSALLRHLWCSLLVSCKAIYSFT